MLNFCLPLLHMSNTVYLNSAEAEFYEKHCKTSKLNRKPSIYEATIGRLVCCLSLQKDVKYNSEGQGLFALFAFWPSYMENAQGEHFNFSFICLFIIMVKLRKGITKRMKGAMS